MQIATHRCPLPILDELDYTSKSSPRRQVSPQTTENTRKKSHPGHQKTHGKLRTAHLVRTAVAPKAACASRRLPGPFGPGSPAARFVLADQPVNPLGLFGLPGRQAAGLVLPRYRIRLPVLKFRQN